MATAALTMAGAPGGQPAETPPPVLRGDLDLHAVDPDPDGAPAWVVHDPAAGRYFRLGREAVDVLSLVDGRPAAAIAQAAADRFGHQLTAEDIDGLFRFLRANNLVQLDATQETLFRRARERRPGLLTRTTKGYISFRVPLVRPDRFLDATLPYVRPLASRAAFILLVMMALAGAWLVGRQWELFLATFVGLFSLEGLLAYGGVIVLVKAAHELGHAYAAKARGLRVPTMGVAFIVFYPIAYTDTSDAWKLERRGDRLAIGAAGVGVELGIAAVSLFLWNIVPDGPLRQVLFLLATTTWLFSLLINLNPLMRFDGYFLFSDLVRIPNLERRAHAMGKWRLRELLFGFGDPCPDPNRRWLIGYSWAIWIYRFFLFLGIALAVYLLFAKAIGIVAAVVEIAYFIGLPIMREMREWGRRAKDIRWNRTALRNVTLLVLFLAWALLPWQGSVRAPALLVLDSQTIFSPEAGRLVQPPPADGQRVRAGETLAVLQAPALTHELAQAIRRHDELVLEVDALGVDSLRRERALVLQAELAAEKRVIAALQRRLDRLTLTSPLDGVVRDRASGLMAGGWIGADRRLMEIVAENGRRQLEAYVDEREVGRLSVGADARFWPDHGLAGSITAVVTSIDPAGLEQIDQPLITSSWGGGVSVRRTDDGTAIPLTAVYRVVLSVPADAALAAQLSRGTVVIAARPQSPFSALWNRLVALVLRESGF